ncbi:MAG: HWE histidine kinase domain-containing protein [Burkholderiaceae bacterium]
MSGPSNSFAPVEIFITDELERRAPKHTDYLREKLALQDLAQQVAGDPDQVLSHLSELAIQLCGATSAGISLLEENPAPGIFRWHYLRGTLSRFEGATTPRDFSPCGICLDLKKPMLACHPERYYTWIVDAGITAAEVLLVPLYLGAELPLGTLWVVSDYKGTFDSGHARVMTELAAFAGMVVRILRFDQQLKQALEQQVILTKEMNHRVKNLFAIADGMIRMTARTTSTPDEMARVLSDRLHALADATALVRRGFAGRKKSSRGADLTALINTIISPHRTLQQIVVDGPPVELGDRTVNSIALILHELATNSAKYGCLKVDNGSLHIAWKVMDQLLVLNWSEFGGPSVETVPAKTGFGTTLLTSTVTGQLGGTFHYNWLEQGLALSITIPMARLVR